MRSLYNQMRFPYLSSTFLLVLLFIAGIATAQNDTTLTWLEAIDRVVKENPNLASAEASLEATRENIAIAKSKYLPGIAVASSLSQSKTSTFSENAGIIPASSAILGASISQMIYNESYFANHKIQKYLYESAKEEYRNTSYLTISSTGKSYIGLLFALDLLEVQEQNKLITAQNLAAAKDRLEVGSTNRQEVLRWQTQLFSNQQDIETQKATILNSRAILNQLLNQPLETMQDLEKLSLEKDGFIFSNKVISRMVTNDMGAQKLRDYLVAFGLINSPIISSLDQQMLAQNRQLQSAKRWAIPKFSASGGADAKFALDPAEADVIGDDLGYWKFGISMYWPIVSGGANYNKVQQANYQMTAIDYQRHNISTSIEQSIRSIIAVVISDYVNIDLATSQAEAAHENYELVYDSYLEGESSLLNLLDAQTQKLGADISSRIALYTFFIDLMAMEQAIGFFPFLESEEDVNALINEIATSLLQVEE